MFSAGVKEFLSAAAQHARGATLTVVCIHDGMITQLEQDEMHNILTAAENTILQKMSYYDFLQKYDPSAREAPWNENFEQLAKKSIVLSCPEFGTLDPHGGPNASTGGYDSPVMLTVMRLQKLSFGAIQMGFDRAGTSTSDERDRDVWEKLNPKTAVYVSDVTVRKKLVKQTIWFAGYKAAAKAQMKLACQAFDGLVEIICLKGGLVTDVEQEEMDTIIADGIQDAKKSGVECQIERKDMSFYTFVHEYGEPYGVTVESLLVPTPAESGSGREHRKPEPQQEPQPEPQPEPEVDVSAGVPLATSPEVQSWSEEQVATWLRDVLKLGVVADAALEEEVDGATALEMDKEGWKELGASAVKSAKIVAQLKKLV